MVYKILKRFFDVVLSFIAILFFLVPWIIIAIIIKIQSPGPILYKPDRIGKDGKVFTLFKFRSMIVNSGSVHATTLRNDPRVFSFGAFLRKSKLDETPQLLNIIKGEMSIIGPRPEDKSNANRIYVGKYRDILSVKPGLSSPASLYDYTHGEICKSEEEYVNAFEPKKLDVELFYVKHCSFLYDAQIIFRTIATIILIMFGKKEFKEPKELSLLQIEE